VIKTQLPQKEVDAIIDAALKEDTGHGDVTTQALIPPEMAGKAAVLIKEKGVLAGIDVFARVFKRIDPLVKTEILIKDGTPVKPGDIAANLTGCITTMLKGERTALNLVQRMSGIASLTAQYVAEVAGLRAKIVDTRKTTPGLRLLEKYAVLAGGGQNHRKDLAEAVLIKDNHIAALRMMGLGLREIIAKARQNAPAGITIEIEVTNTKEAADALKGGADVILLDNMSPNEMKQVVSMAGGRVKLEASGGITLENVQQVAMTGVDVISIGALTHSFKSLDISLEMESQTLQLV
jgi:nicotinate-nucleotide pyrophosphorylase (carboxylating)